MYGLLASLCSLSVHAQPSYGGCNIFPANMMWNVKIDELPVHPNNDHYATTIGTTKLHLDMGTTTDQQSAEYYGIPWNQVANPTWVPITFDPDNNYYSESDCATGTTPPYTLHSPCGSNDIPLTNVKLPIPQNALVEAGIHAAPNDQDHHLCLVDTTNCVLWEVYQTYKDTNGWWTNGGIARWNMKSGDLRPAGWTSSDAAGLPVMPLLLRQNEATVVGGIKHALRFTLDKTKIQGDNTVWEWPCTHNTGRGDTNTPKMGQRFRLKKSFTIPASWSVQSKAVATALKEYGLILADIGSAMYIQGEPNANWDLDTLLPQIQSINASAFEAVDISSWKAAPGWNVSSGLVPLSAANSSSSATPTPSTPSGSANAGRATEVSLALLVGLFMLR